MMNETEEYLISDPGDIRKRAVLLAAERFPKLHTEAIFSGLKHELEKDPNGKQVDIKRNNPITTELVMSDAIIVLKDGVKLNYNICKAFRSHNLLVIKAGSESFDFRDFKLLLGEAFLHASKAQIDLENVTTSAILTDRPEKLFQDLNERASFYPMKTVSKGLVHIQVCGFLVQLVMCKELRYEENLWLRAYAEDKPDQNACEAIIREASQEPSEIEAYMKLFLKKEAVWKFFNDEINMSESDKNKLLKAVGVKAE
jgi:hypothetical protein